MDYIADTSSPDLGPVAWAATAKLALARGLSSAIILCLAATFMGSAPIGAILAFFIPMALVIAIGAPLYHFMIRGIRSVLGGLPFVGLACNLILILCSLVVAIGDPIVFAVNKRFPELLGLADFKPFNLFPAIFVHQ